MAAPLTWAPLPSVLGAQGSGSPLAHQVSRPACLIATWSLELNEEVASLFSQAPAQASLPGNFTFWVSFTSFYTFMHCST